MCGIVGHIDFRGLDADSIGLAHAASLMAARGPDDEGFYTDAQAALAHRRLSILDISVAGHQPMSSACGRYVIVYNGEIYNFRELRKQLASRHGRWISDSDTEVVLAAYMAWGPACLEGFRGMFAIAIWDTVERRLFAARDRMGVKPFYYHASGTAFMFASRPRALRAMSPGLGHTLDINALRLYLESGYIPAPLSIDEEIRKLPPAHYMLVDADGVRLHRYWDFRGIAPDTSLEHRSEDDLLDELDGIVERAVRSRMISDVPLGAFLSGGIDSSLVVAMMQKHSSRAVSTFTIGFEDKTYDESSHAEAVARHLGTEHYCEHLQVDDLLHLLPTFSKSFDEPFFDSSAFPVMAVSRLARRHVSVSLSGDGADELFGGYHYYGIAHKLACIYRLPGPLRRAAAWGVQQLPGHRFQLLSGALRQRDAASAFAFSRSISKDYVSVLLPDVLHRTSGFNSFFSQQAAQFADGLTAAEQGMRLDSAFTLPDDYLQKVDVGSMAFSLESREPLLDHELVEWAMRLPLSWKLRQGTNKYLLRKLAYRYVPREILDRPKQGFCVPIDAWLRGPLNQWAKERIHDAAVFRKLPLDQSKVIGLMALHESGARNVHPLLWAILMLLDYTAIESQGAPDL